MRWVASVLTLLLWLPALGVAGAAEAAPGPKVCHAEGSLLGVDGECQSEEQTLTAEIAAAPSGTVYKTVINCKADATTGAVCANPVVCDSPPGSVLYDVQQSTDFGQTFATIREVCLTNPPAGQPPAVTPGMVEQRFKSIDWGASPLVVQPPGGRTLVNLATNFYTDNTGPRVQPVEILGQQVEIEATPESWTWVHGDGTSQSTSVPGTAYPDLTITHVYADAGVRVAPQVDTVYRGRYRVNGGPWVDIAATRTIAGVPGSLEVVSARPQLVGAD